MKQVKGNQQIALREEDLIEVAPARIWYRQPKESPRLYSYFKMYLEQPVPRKVGRLAKQLRMQHSGLARYCADYKWLERAAAFDDHNNEAKLDRKRREREKQDEVWLARRDEQRQQEWDIAQQFLQKVRQMLNTPLFKETITEYLDSLDPQGRIIIKQVITYEPLDWSPSDMAKFFEIGSKIARLATGQETDRKKIKIDFGKLSDEELDELLTEG